MRLPEASPDATRRYRSWRSRCVPLEEADRAGIRFLGEESRVRSSRLPYRLVARFRTPHDTLDADFGLQRILFRLDSRSRSAPLLPGTNVRPGARTPG